MRLGSSHRVQEWWLSRAVRGARLDRNPLRRGTDRAQTCLLAGLLVAAIGGAPFAAQAASNAAYQAGLHLRHEQLASRHQVRAVLTSNAPQVNGYGLDASVLTAATWTSVKGVRRSGDVPAEPGSPTGTAVTVWTDDATGSIESPPLSLAEAAGQADAAMVGVIAGTCFGYVAAAGLTVGLLNRRRLAAWEADWQVTARAWNHQSW